MYTPSPERHLLNHSLAMALLGWNLHVFQPALALRKLGLYRPSTLGAPPEPSGAPGGGSALSLRFELPVLLAEEPENYESVREFDQVSDLYEAIVRPFSDPI